MDEKLNINPADETQENIEKSYEEIQQEVQEQDEKDNPEQELTEEEQKELYVQMLKDSRIKFRNTVHDGNVTRTQFGPKYKQKRKRKNTLAKKSRQKNRR